MSTLTQPLTEQFNWTQVARWAAAHLEQASPQEAMLLHEILDIVQVREGKAPQRAVQDPTPEAVTWVPVPDWLFLPSAQLHAQVLQLLGQPVPSSWKADLLQVLPPCALVACREYQLPLAANLLRLMVHARLSTPVVQEVADFLAFQQRPDGSCGFTNPLKPPTFRADQGFSAFSLPATHGIVKALHTCLEEEPSWNFALNN